MKARDPNSERRYGMVESVRIIDGNARVDVRDLETPGRIERDLYVERGAPGQIHVPQTGWVVSMTPDNRGELVVTGIVSGPESVSSRGTDFGFTPPGGTDNFDQRELDPGAYIRQFDKGTALHARPGAGGFDLELHSLNDLKIRVGGNLDLEQAVPEPSEDGVAAGTHGGGTPMKVLTQQEWDDLQTQLSELEAASYNTYSGRVAYKNSLDIDHVFQDVDLSGPGDNALSLSPPNVVDAVADLGWDNTGGTAISLATDIQDDREIQVPPGTYLLGANIDAVTVSNFKMVGTGSTRGDVVFTTGGNPARWLFESSTSAGDVELGNFTCDQGSTDTDGGPCIGYDGNGDAFFHDIEYIGFTPTETNDLSKCRMVLRNPNAVGMIRDVKMTGPSELGGHGNGEGMGIMDQGHDGTVYVRRTHIENCPAVPWYVSGHGVVHFQNCYHANNCQAQFRIGGTSTVQDCTAVVDLANAHSSNTGGYTDAGDLSGGSVNAVFLAGQTGKNHGGRVVNTDIYMVNNIDTDGTTEVNGQALRFHDTANATTIKNVRIQWDIDNQNYVVFAVGRDSGYGGYDPSPPYFLEFDNVDITGTGAVDTVYQMDQRPGCRLTKGCIDMANATTLFTDTGDTSWDEQNYDTSGCETPTS